MCANVLPLYSVFVQNAIRVRVYANCRVRRIFFSDRSYNDWELPLCLRVKPNNQNEQQKHVGQYGSNDSGAQVKDEESKEQSEQTNPPAVRIAEVMEL